ncbi:alpha carbonic anhydrase [Mycena capillaripes]|nr:alpha carbonic anhydrase [Mycena capillaripes]
MAFLNFLRATVLLTSFVVSISASCAHGTSVHPRAAGEAHVSDFSYSDTHGPLAWAGLNPTANCACRLGTKQSPIVLNGNINTATSAPTVNIQSLDSAQLLNLGSTLEVVIPQGVGSITFNGKRSNLKQFHFHTPSEHRINEEHYPLEMHLVHQADDRSIIVVGVLFELSEDGTTTSLLTSVLQNLGDVTAPGATTVTGPLNFGPLATAVTTGPLYNYVGSLTTPPCTEGVTFLILAKPLPLNVATYNAMKRVLKFNARYTQNILGQINLLEEAAEIADTQVLQCLL